MDVLDRLQELGARAKKFFQKCPTTYPQNPQNPIGGRVWGGVSTRLPKNALPSLALRTSARSLSTSSESES